MPKSIYIYLGTAVFTFAIAGLVCFVRTKCPPAAVTMCPRPTVNVVVGVIFGPMKRDLICIDSLTVNPILTNNVSDCGLTVSGLHIPATEN